MYISRVIHVVMQEMGYTEEQIAQYFKMLGDVIVTKTHGKKTVGGINRMVMDAQYFDKKLEKEAKYQWELSEYLNRDICQPEGFDAYGYPSELFKLDMERLVIVPKRKPAKVRLTLIIYNKKVREITALDMKDCIYKGSKINRVCETFSVDCPKNRRYDIMKTIALLILLFN